MYMYIHIHTYIFIWVRFRQRFLQASFSACCIFRKSAARRYCCGNGRVKKGVVNLKQPVTRGYFWKSVLPGHHLQIQNFYSVAKTIRSPELVGRFPQTGRRWANKYRALVRKIICIDTASYGSDVCICMLWSVYTQTLNSRIANKKCVTQRRICTWFVGAFELSLNQFGWLKHIGRHMYYRSIYIPCIPTSQTRNAAKRRICSWFAQES